MPLPTHHYYVVKHPPGFWLHISINDLPFYRRFSDCHQAPSGPINHWLVQGENKVVMTLVKPESSGQREFTAAFEILRFSDDRPLFILKYPDFTETLPAVEQPLPLVYHANFHYDEDAPRPVWQDAPKSDFTPAGTPELRQAVFDLYDAFRRKDVDAFVRAAEVKTTELQRFYGPMPGLTPNAMHAEQAANFAEPWDLAPLDFNDIVFERRGNGRTAYVWRKDGGPALFAKHQTDPERTWEANLHLTQVNGAWRIFF